MSSTKIADTGTLIPARPAPVPADIEAARLPLSGLKVIDLTIWLYGPLAGTLLADLGAEVIKIERPGHGDFTRSLTTLQGASMLAGERNLTWELFNRNKRSVTLDMRSEEGADVFRKLIADADAFITNFQPSTLAAFNALPSQLFAINPRLVYGLGAGLGTKGAFADVPSQDTAAMAYSGFMMTTSPGGEEPYYPPGGLADVLSGTNLAFGVVSALLGRERAGGDSSSARPFAGSLVTTSLLQTMMWTQMLNVGVPANNGERLASAPRAQASNPLMNTYACRDGRFVALGVPTLSDDVWKNLVRALEEPRLHADPRFSTESARWAHRPAIVAILDETFRRACQPDWLSRLRDCGIWSAPVNRPEDLLDDPAVLQEGLVTTTATGVRHVRSPFTLEGAVTRDGGAPALGGDTDAVLHSLGFAGEEIERLRSKGVI